MEVYVQSGGVSKEYSWVNEQNQPTVLPDDDLKPMINMVDSNYFSVVIYRPKQDRLLLLVTALPSKSRMDNRTRTIYNSVLWVGTDSDEATLRAIAIKALDGELANKVDEAVHFTDENAVHSIDNDKGFYIDDFNKLKPEKLDLDTFESETDDSEKNINLYASKDTLTKDLKKYRLPEKKKGMLVVVSSTVSRPKLEENKVRRGFSDTISDDECIKFSVKEDKDVNFPSKNVGRPNSTNSTIGLPLSNQPNPNHQNSGEIKKWLNLIAAFILGLVIGIIANQLWYHFTEDQLQQKIQSLKGDITELEQEKNSLGKAIKIKQQEIQVYEKFESESETRYSHFRDEVEKSYDSFIRDSEKSKQALQSEINALQNKANELNAKSS